MRGGEATAFQLMRFSDGTLDQIRTRVDIVELVREYVPGLKRAGRHWKACCPFHGEKTPSFMVNPDRQIFHCFGCNEGGDLFKFLMRLENLSFPEAVEQLAGRAGIKLEGEAGGGMSAKDKERLGLRKALEFAVGFYRETLKKSPAAETARKYLVKRRIPAEAQETFALGYAPADGTLLMEAALKAGITQQTLQTAGLAGYQSERGRYYDFFRDRLLFPIFDAKGEVVGFGGRVLGDGQPKYLNGPDTPLFSKSKVLYGLSQAAPAMRKARRAIVLEGYTDVIGCHRHGFTFAVAPLGTALTVDHAALLKRYAEEIVLLFDPDAAGNAASLRGAEILMEADVNVRIATMPAGLDPDEFLDEKGPDAFIERLDGAVDLAEFKTALVLAELPKAPSLDEKVKAAASVLETIAKQPNLIMRKEWVRRLAAKLDLDPEALAGEMARKAPRQTRGTLPPAPSRKREGGVEEKKAAPLKAPKIEEELLQFYLKYPEWMLKEPRLDPKELSDERIVRMLETLKELAAAKVAAPAATLSERFPEDAGWVTGLAMDERPVGEPAEFLGRLLSSLRRIQNEARWKELQGRAKARELSPDELRELAVLGKSLKG